MTWPTKRQWQWQIHRQRQWQRQINIENPFKERPQSLVTFETFDQSDEEIWPDQKNRQMKTTNINTKTTIMTKTYTFRDHLHGAILETCDLCNIRSEWWGDMNWPRERQWQRQIQRQWQWQWHRQDNPRDFSHLKH